MKINGFTTTADTSETVYAEYTLENWDMVDDIIEEYDGDHFTITGYWVTKYDDDGNLLVQEWLETKELAEEFIKGQKK